MRNDLHPSNCGESIKIGETYICKLSTAPCALYYGTACTKLKIGASMKAIREIMKETFEPHEGSGQ